MNIPLSLILAVLIILILSGLGRKFFKMDSSSFPLVIIFYILVGIILYFPLRDQIKLMSPFFLLSLGIVGFIEGASMNFFRLRVKSSFTLPFLRFLVLFSFFYFSFHFISGDVIFALSFATVFTPVSFYGLKGEKIVQASLWEVLSILPLGVIFSLKRGSFAESFLLHLLFGIVLGLIAYVSLGIKANRAERNAIIIGILLLGAASASYLLLSPIFVGFLGGMVYANLPRFTAVENFLPELLVLEKPAFLFILIYLGMVSTNLIVASVLVALSLLLVKFVPAVLWREPGYISIPPISVAIGLSLFLHFMDVIPSYVLSAFTLALVFLEIAEYTVLNYRKKGIIILKRGR